MVEIIGLIVIIIGSSMTLVALLTLLPFLMPHKVAQTETVLQQSPRRAFVIGLVNFIFFSVIAVILAQGGDFGGVLAMLLMLALFSMATIGLAAVTLIVQQRIYEDAPQRSMNKTLKTSTLIVFAGLFPFIGWFVLTPIVLLACLGSLIMVLVRREKQSF